MTMKVLFIQDLNSVVDLWTKIVQVLIVVIQSVYSDTATVSTVIIIVTQSSADTTTVITTIVFHVILLPQLPILLPSV